MFLQKGDEAYKSGDYAEAVTAYSAAVDSFPDAPAVAEMRQAALQRLAQASTEHGRQLAQKGDVEGAKAVLDRVLADGVMPDDQAALTYRAQLDDPIRTNPALTAEHAANVDEVRRGLYMAEGAYDLGKFDEATERYKDVLRIDPYNKAARRGMEKVTAQKREYARSAYDEARASILGEVDAAWELPLKPKLDLPELQRVTELDGLADRTISLRNKLSRIEVPNFQLEGATLMEAMDLFRLRARENDTFELDPRFKGVNITANLGSSDTSPAKEILSRKLELQLSNVPLDEILKYITENTGTRARVDEFAITLLPAGAGSEELINRNFRVPPDLLSNLAATAGDAVELDEIFDAEIGEGGILPERMGVQEALAKQGVLFPDGASASLNGSTNILRVTNTANNLDIIEQIVSMISLTEPVSVAVRVTMLKVEQNRLEEIGFDWLLDNFSFGDSAGAYAEEFNIAGGSVGNGTAITDVPGVPGGRNAVTNPITAGNRSGDGAISTDSINSLIAAGSSGGRQSNDRAPGVFGVNGTIDSGTLRTLMRGLDQKKGVDIMARPSVTTRSGQSASIFVVEEFIYPTEYEPPELPTNVGTVDIFGLGEGGFFNGIGPQVGAAPVTPATPTAFEKKDVGVTLEVLPVADANKQFVDVTLSPTITEFDGFINYGSPINSVGLQGDLSGVTSVLTENSILMPVFSVRRTNSNLIVADGATIVIGGLLKDEIEDVEDKTPILGDIPVVGKLFRSDARSHTSTAVVFFVNVQLLDPTGRPYADR